MQEMAPRFSKFYGGGGDTLANSLAALSRVPRIITLQSIFETWQACTSEHVECNRGSLRNVLTLVSFEDLQHRYSWLKIHAFGLEL